jgi:hypothetical protein
MDSLSLFCTLSLSLLSFFHFSISLSLSLFSLLSISFLSISICFIVPFIYLSYLIYLFLSFFFVAQPISLESLVSSVDQEVDMMPLKQKLEETELRAKDLENLNKTMAVELTEKVSK